jgi:Alternative complex III, ActD subunit
VSRTRVDLYGLMAEFASPEALLVAAQRARAAGYRDVEAYTPYPIEEIGEALGHHRSRLPLIVLIGGLLGAVGGFALQYWTAVIAYPLNIGGRPLNSWPAFIVPTFECTILAAALAAVLGMFILNGLPMPYHPVFNVPRFALASRDRYFLVVKRLDPRFDRVATRAFLDGLGPAEVSEVDY